MLCQSKSCITVETSCTANAQQIAVMELEGYSWSTCSKQPWLNLSYRWRQQTRPLRTCDRQMDGHMTTASGVMGGIQRIPASGYFWQRILTSVIINKQCTFRPFATPLCVYPPPFLAIHHWPQHILIHCASIAQCCKNIAFYVTW